MTDRLTATGTPHAIRFGTGDTDGADPGETGTTWAIEWRWGETVAIAFDPAVDRLDFGWFKAHEFSIAETGGDVVISIDGNRQSYVLTGVTLAEMSMSAIAARDPGARAEWQAALDAAAEGGDAGDGDAGGDPPAIPTISIADAQGAEGGLVALTVTLSAPTTAPVRVDWAAVSGEAMAGADFVAASGTLTFAPGETVRTLHVQGIEDAAAEADERFSVMLSGAAGAEIADGRAQVILRDDDAPPQPPADDGEVAFDLRDAWTGGFVADLSVRAGTSALAGWTVSFRADFEIVNIWNARVVSHENGVYVLENLSYNARIGAGAQTGFGFQAAGETSAIAGLSLNGDAVAEPPRISVAGGQATEGEALDFAVSLSAAADGPVRVHYQTQSGSAEDGTDFAGLSGALTFAAGEMTKTVSVATLQDALAEGAESFALVLSDASGAGLGEASATGVIRDGDPPPVPKISVADAETVEGDPGQGAAAGWFSTSGAQIVDAAGNPVRIAGVNWFGFESDTFAPHGLWARGYVEMMDQMAALGFNAIRLPFSSEMLRTEAASNGIDFSKNPDLRGLSALEIMDRIVDYAGEIGLRVILDHHRSAAGAGTSGNGLWHGEGGFSEQGWIDDWRMLAARYAADPTVIGADLHNEPHAGTWGGGGANDWARAAEAAGDAIGAVNPDWLIFVEGVGSYQGESYWWGGQLQGAADRPIHLAVENKLVYSAHDYGHSVHAQPWFQDPDFAEDLPAIFRENWGFLVEDGVAPVLVGEFGAKLEDPRDRPWLEALTAYLGGDYDGDGASDLEAGELGVSWTYWSWNPNSGDTGGILADDWMTPQTEKLAYLEDIQFDFDTGGGDGGGAGGGAGSLVFDVTLSAPASGPVSVDWAAVPGDAGAEDFALASGQLRFAAGEDSARIRIAVTPDDLPEGDETLILRLSDPVGARLADAQAVGTILDDDLDADGASGAGLLLV